MTLNYGIFDVSDPANPDRVYSAALLSRIVAKHIRDGIVHGDGDKLAVSASDPPAMTVRIATGTAMVQGRFCENDAAMTLAVPAADATYARIDRVVVRLSASPGRVVDILVKPGTPAPAPSAPALTRTPETWELSLAQIAVAAGARLIQAANIADERADAALCGVACSTYLPSSQLEITAPVEMQGKALTGLPVPGASTAAATKSYVDTATSDRSMGGHKITNLGAPTNASDAARKSYVDATLPIGGIILWSGSIATIPSNWKLCDGNNGTPDLRDRFVVGAGSGYAVGATGGATSVTLTVDQLPSHTHSGRAAFGSGNQVTEMYNGNGWESMYTTGATGGGQAHENRPPYYALAYIMRVA